MSAANFRHGPVEVVDKDFHAVVFGSEPGTADLDAVLAEDLGSMTGEDIRSVRWIGPPVTGRKLVPLCPWPANVPNRFAPVFEIIPLQIAAYQVAERRGVTPGEFRYAPAVTVSETGFSGPGLS
jgi:glutamine---fructose-6-phosphate transaminase (isomerizing)